ncbi:MAG: HD domain-containing protein, partial [Gammaproteobacteria bacterium]
PNRALVSTSSEYDVTGKIRVSRMDDVRNEVRDIFRRVYPDASFDPVATAFTDFEHLFNGTMQGFVGCDTVYHDMQHSLDVTLAMARLLGGHEKHENPRAQLGHRLMTVGVVAALFHDAGYIRRDNDDGSHTNGAHFTKSHISRGATFLSDYMPRIGLAEFVDVAIEAVHFTGYERSIDTLGLDAPKTRVLGKLLGTADLVAQMSDRCYLEKCRDRLFPEFVLGGLAVAEGQNGSDEIQYESGEELLKKTPEFFRAVSQQRLDKEFGRSYRYFKFWFEGSDPYSVAIHKNLSYLQEVLKDGDWSKLRRVSSVVNADSDSLSDTQRMARAELDRFFAARKSS